MSVRADGNSLGDSASHATTMGSVGDGGEAALEGFEAEALGIVGEIVAQEQVRGYVYSNCVPPSIDR